MPLPEDPSAVLPARINYLSTVHDVNAEAISTLNSAVPGRMEIVEVTRDFGVVAAHSGGNYVETILGLAVGDLCFFMGMDAGANVNSFVIRTRPLCATVDSITVDYYNSHSAGLDPASMTHTYLVIHRS